MGNLFGRLFRVMTFGESHGGAVGVVLDGCPPLLPLSKEAIQKELNRRRPGQSDLVTPRNELDEVEILSGVFEGKTLGTPITMIVKNKDAKPEAYRHLKDVYRPSHADYTYQKKFGIRNWQGGGRSSARETIGRVASGAVAKIYLKKKYAIEILAYVTQIYDVIADDIDSDTVTLEQIESNAVRCPSVKHEAMKKKILDAKSAGDSLGGRIVCVIRGCPVGLGEPVFDKLKADLAKAMMSIPATMGFEIGSGFASILMTGKSHNDSFYISSEGNVRTKTNHSGGIQGGISNGENIVFSVAFKPTATVSALQETISSDHEAIQLEAKGRHDPCVLPRAVPIVESMAALVLADHSLLVQSKSK